MNSEEGTYAFAAFCRRVVYAELKVTSSLFGTCQGVGATHAGRRHGRLEELVGFITARVSPLRDCNATDRALLGLGSPYFDDMQVHACAKAAILI